MSKRSAKQGTKKAKFLHKPTCTSWRKARGLLQRRGFLLDFRDLAKERLSAAELEKLIGPRDYTEFLNPRNELFRRKKMKVNPPPKREAIRMMTKEPNLIRRPVFLFGGRVVLGFDEKGIKNL